MLPVGEGPTAADRLNDIGFDVRTEGDKVFVDLVVFASNAEKIGIDFDQEIIMVMMPSDRPPKQIMFIPALALLGLIYLLQRRRKVRLKET
jgi:hypothetical protein